MTVTIQLKGGTAEEHSSFIGKDREITVDTTDNRLRVHDGVTAGGHPLAKESEIKTKTSEYQNDVYHTKTSLTKLSQLTADIAYWKKSELTKISQLTNDSGYVAGHCTYCTYCSYCTNCS
jgi:hypothetical protein